jgi:type II secretory ATPase GspE/PulE/Tfp pilus assembly ATPase PilB-like protein
MGATLVLAAEQVSGGGYVSIWKIIPPILILLLWGRLLTWADKDAPAAHLPRIGLNLGMMAGLVVAWGLFFFLPNYWVALGALVLVMGAEIGTYLGIRKSKVGVHDLKDQFRDWLKSFKKEKTVEAGPGQVMLFTKGGQAMPPPQSDSPDRGAYDATQLALTEPLLKGAERIDLDGRSEQGMQVKYLVDGVEYPGRLIDRVSGSAAIGYLKGTAGLDVEDRRKPQMGAMKFTANGQKMDVRVQTAGSTAGEYMRLTINPKKRHEFQLDQLGFNERQLQIIMESVRENKGLVILSTPKTMGLTSLMYGMLRGHDAFLQHIQTIERDPEQELEGITQNKLPPNASPADEYKMVDWIISQEPDVILAAKVEDSRSAVDLLKYAKTGKRVYVGMQAGSTFEALEQWRRLVGDDNLAVDPLVMIINGRVVRKLCNACKQGYAPDPGTLRKLGMNPEKVTQLFQARTQPMRDNRGNPIPCEFCHDLHFNGRTGVFELMEVDDEMRAAVGAGKAAEQAFRKKRGRYLQEEALELVEKGDTSVQEVKRVLKPEATPSPPPPPVAAVGGGRRR